MRIVTIRIYRILMLFRNGNLGLSLTIEQDDKDLSQDDSQDINDQF